MLSRNQKIAMFWEGCVYVFFTWEGRKLCYVWNVSIYRRELYNVMWNCFEVKMSRTRGRCFLPPSQREAKAHVGGKEGRIFVGLLR